MTEIPGYTFRPWVGRSYADPHNRWDQRVLILGESHYDEDFDQGPDLTTWVIRRHVRKEGKQYAFWTKVGRTFVGPDYGPPDTRRTFWDSVAFYNYVQTFAGVAARQRPSADDFSSSWPVFTRVLEDLRPTVVVGLGFGLRDAMRPLLPPGSRLGIRAPQGEPPSYWTLRVRDASVVLGFVKHPSTGYRPPDWRPVVSALLRRAQGKDPVVTDRVRTREDTPLRQLDLRVVATAELRQQWSAITAELHSRDVAGGARTELETATWLATERPEENAT